MGRACGCAVGLALTYARDWLSALFSASKMGLVVVVCGLASGH
jgi:hypothetical protein